MQTFQVRRGTIFCLDFVSFLFLKPVRFLFVVPHFWLLIFSNLKTYGNEIDFCFNGPTEGHRLDSGVIKHVHAKSGVDCVLQCLLQDESCRSVNFRKNSASDETENCELLFVVDSEEPELLYEDENFDYYILLQPDRTGIVTVGKASTCNEMLNENPTLKNGVYYLQNKASTQQYPVYCHMTKIPGCGSGGWTLVMKTDGDASTFTYHSPLWTNKESFSVEDGLEGLTEKESKLASYWNTPFKKICLGMTVNGSRKWMMFDYEASSLYRVVADEQYKSTSAGREAWRTLVANSSLQQNCNQEGFNIAYQEFKIRIGLYANNQDRCTHADSGIGFGITYEACNVISNITCGNLAQCNGNDNGLKLTAAFGYILVQ